MGRGEEGKESREGEQSIGDYVYGLSQLGGKTYLPENICIKNFLMPELCMKNIFPTFLGRGMLTVMEWGVNLPHGRLKALAALRTLQWMPVPVWI